MDTEDAESTASLLRDAIDRFGIDPRREPDRAVAIVADLAARPGQSSIPTIPALRSTLRIAAAESSAITTRRRAECVAEATAAGVDPATAAGILDLVLTEAPTPESEPAAATAPTHPIVRTRTALLLGGGAVAVIVVGLLVVFLGGSGSEPNATTATTPPTNTATTPTASIATPTPTAVVSEVVPDSVADDEASDTSSQPTTVESGPGVVDESTDTTVVIADFAPARDGVFLVSREWRISDGEIATTVLLENPGDEPIAGLHREFPPPLPNTDPESAVWQPAPTSLIATTAVFGQVTLDAGQTFEITYRSATSAADPTTQDVLAWYEAWRPQAEGLNSVLGTSAAFAAPEIRTE